MTTFDVLPKKPFIAVRATFGASRHFTVFLFWAAGVPEARHKNTSIVDSGVLRSRRLLGLSRDDFDMVRRFFRCVLH